MSKIARKKAAGCSAENESRVGFSGGGFDRHSGWAELRRGDIRIRWIGWLMLGPVVFLGVVLSLAFYRTFSRVLVPEIQGRGRNLLWVSFGIIVWLMVLCLGKMFVGRLVGLRVYVLAHELTHLIWTLLSGGRGRLERVGKKGGAMITDRTNLMIVLSPYFYPLLTVAVVIVTPLVGWLGDFYAVGEVWQVRLDGLLYGLVGLTLTHHYTFTIYVLRRGQSDLRYYGKTFSLAVIWVMNVVVLTVVLLMLPRTAPFDAYGGELFESFGIISDALVPLMERCCAWMAEMFSWCVSWVRGGVSAGGAV
jgi:hypothetical protein